MAFSFKLYDSDLDILTKVDKESMTVKEFKISQQLKTGIWGHPKDPFYKQTYQIKLYTAGEIKILNEDDIIDFTNCPRIRITLQRSV